MKKRNSIKTFKIYIICQSAIKSLSKDFTRVQQINLQAKQFFSNQMNLGNIYGSDLYLKVAYLMESVKCNQITICLDMDRNLNAFRRMILFERKAITIVTADKIGAFGIRAALTNEIETQFIKISQQRHEIHKTKNATFFFIQKREKQNCQMIYDAFQNSQKVMCGRSKSV